MSTRHPIRSLGLRYRRRKQISTQGFTPGLEYDRPRGHTTAPRTGHAAQRSQQVYDPLASPEEYDPVRAVYVLDGPHYTHLDTWHDEMMGRTPPIRAPLPLPPETQPSVPSYDHTVMIDQIISEIALERTGVEYVTDDPGLADTHTPSLVPHDEPGEPTHAVGPGLGPALVAPIEDLQQEMAEFEAALLLPEEAVCLEPSPLFDEPTGEVLGPPASPTAPTLDDLVDEAMQQIDSFAMMDPYGPMPPPGMHPGTAMGPGFGPSGPM